MSDPVVVSLVPLATATVSAVDNPSRFALHLRLHSLRAELATALNHRHPDEIRADIAAVEHRLEHR